MHASTSLSLNVNLAQAQHDSWHVLDLADVLAQDVHESHVLWRREESHLRIMQVRETRKESARARASHRESARGHVTWHGKLQLSSRHTPSVRRAISCSFNSGLKIQERNSW